jgi:hypothetical protein
VDNFIWKYKWDDILLSLTLKIKKMREINLQELVAEMTYQFTPRETTEQVLFPTDINEENISLLLPIVKQYYEELMETISNSFTEEQEIEWDHDDRYSEAGKILVKNNYNPNYIILTIK